MEENENDLDKVTGFLAALSCGYITSEDFRKRFEIVVETLGLMASIGLGGKKDAMAEIANGALDTIEERVFGV